MKKTLLYIATLALGALTTVSCSLTDEDFNKEFLYSGSGEWVSTQTIGGQSHEIHDRFKSDGTGSSRSATDNAPWQSFTWTLKGAELTFIHEMDTRVQTRALIPKSYTVKTLTETKLVYTDGFKTITCSKL